MDASTIEARQQEHDILFGVINRYIGYFTRKTVPLTSNNTDCEYPFVAMDTRQVYEQLRLARDFLQQRVGMEKNRTFIDVGCGIGNVLLFAEMMEFEAYGIEKDVASSTIARQLLDDDQIFQTSIWEFADYHRFDVVYYFRPFAEKSMQLRFERLIEEQIKPGALLIANRKMDQGIDNSPKFSRISNDWPIWLKRQATGA